MFNFHRHYLDARLAIWRRRQYGSVFDVAKDFILRTMTRWYEGRQPPKRSPLSIHLKSLPDPVYLRPGESDFMVLDEVFSQAEYARVGQWPLPADATIVDLGANIGLASLYFASLYPQSKFVLVEPGQDNCRLIECNCRRLIDQGRLRLHQAFAAAQDGTAGLDQNWQAWALAKVDAIDDRHPAVRCISMPTLLADAQPAHVDLLKCDIEGSERELFRDCSQWIGKIRHLIVETHNSWSDPNDTYTVEQLFSDLRSAGWKFEVTYQMQERLVGIAFLRGIS